MKVFVSVFTSNDGYEEPKVFIGTTKEKIIEQIKKELLYDNDDLYQEFKDEIKDTIDDCSVCTNFTLSPYSVYNYEKDIEI